MKKVSNILIIAFGIWSISRLINLFNEPLSFLLVYILDNWEFCLFFIIAYWIYYDNKQERETYRAQVLEKLDVLIYKKSYGTDPDTN